MVEEAEFCPSQSYPIPVIQVKSLQRQVGALAGAFTGDPSAKVNLVGVTGTNGKSSCVQLIGQALTAIGHVVGNLGTIGNGVWPDLLSSPLTTLDSIALHEHLQQFVAKGATTVAMEVSSHALAQGRVSSLLFNIAVFTSLSHEHLDYHGTMDEYVQALSLIHI